MRSCRCGRIELVVAVSLWLCAVNASPMAAGPAERSGWPAPTEVLPSGPQALLTPTYIGPGMALAVNSHVQAVGRETSYNPAGERAFLWTHGVLTDLVSLAGANFSAAYGLNEAGQAVGYSGPGSQRRAVLWQEGGVFDLGTLGGRSSEARAINAAGVSVGCSEVNPTSAARQAFVRAPSGPMSVITTPTGNHNCAYGINDLEQVVGVYSTVGETSVSSQAFLWHGGVITPLLGLGGPASAANAINGLGQVVGWATVITPAGHDAHAQHAALWQGQGVTDLGTLPGGAHSWAWSINRAGQAVGAATLGAYSTGVTHAVLWQQGGITDLNDLLAPITGCTFYAARAIADDGRIVADGDCNGVLGAYLLTPTWPRHAAVFLALLIKP